MSFHPEKCNVLSIIKKRNPVTNCYILHGHQLEQVQSAKYLGVSITSDMKWSEHIANICKKANNTLSFLKRNLNISNSNLKEKAYQSLVRPTLEYASTTWNPHQQNNKHRIILRRSSAEQQCMWKTDITTSHQYHLSASRQGFCSVVVSAKVIYPVKLIFYTEPADTLKIRK